MDMVVLGQRLRERRKQMGLSQMDVAKQAHVIQGDLSLLERGEKKHLWADTLHRLLLPGTRPGRRPQPRPVFDYGIGYDTRRLDGARGRVFIQ